MIDNLVTVETKEVMVLSSIYRFFPFPGVSIYYIDTKTKYPIVEATGSGPDGAPFVVLGCRNAASPSLVKDLTRITFHKESIEATHVLYDTGRYSVTVGFISQNEGAHDLVWEYEVKQTSIAEWEKWFP